jgi:hypothetical protein
VTADNGDLIYKTTYSALSSGSLFGKPGTLTDTGSLYDPITGVFTPTYNATTTLLSRQTVSDAVNTKTFTLLSIDANIKVGHVVSYTPSGNLTGANSGSGVVGGTTVAAIGTTVDALTGASLPTITLSDYATIPSGTVLTFSPAKLSLGKTYYYSAFVLTDTSWQRVGTALGTAVKNYKTADTMYDSLPEVYKATSAISSSVSANKNLDLYNFVRPFGVQYDFIKNKVENAKNRYDISNLDGRLIPALMNQMGFTYESGMGLQQGRRLLSYADYIYLNKGTAQGLRQFMSAFSGYGASIAATKNLFLTLDCSSFENSDGFWNGSGYSLSVSKTTSTIEKGAPNPYQETLSPSGHPNSQVGFLKTIARNNGGVAAAHEFSYGVSPDVLTISGTTTNSSTPGYQYITLTTDTEHGLSAGQSVVVQNMSPETLNGVWKILSTPDNKTFTYYNSLITTLQSTIAPVGAGTIAAQIPIGTATIDTQVPSGTTSVSITTSAHSFVVGQSVYISGVTPAAYNGTWVAQPGTTYTTLVISIDANPGAITVGGTVIDPTLTSTTLTTNSAHNITPGQSVVVSGITPLGYNGTWVAQPGTTGTTLILNTGFNPGPITVDGSATAPATVNVYDPKLYGIPVTPTTAYSFSLYSWAKTTVRPVWLGIKWYDQNGTYLSTATPTSTNNVVSTWTRITFVNKTAPTSAAYAVPYVYITGTGNAGEVHYFDAFQFEASATATTYSDSRRIDMYLTAPRINSVINPGFEPYSYTVPTQTPTGTTNITLSTSTAHNLSVGLSVTLAGVTPSGYNGTWTAQLGTTGTTLVLNIGSNPGAITVAGTATSGLSGWTNNLTSPVSTDITNVYPTSAVGLGTAISATSAKITASGTSSTFSNSSAISVVAGNPYSFSAYVKGSHADTVSVAIAWKNVGGTTVQTDNLSATTLSTSTFTRISMTPVDRAVSATKMIAPATAVTALITFTFTGTTGHFYYIDSVLFENSYTVNSYFDGSTGYNNTDDLVWEQNAAGTKGHPSDSRSLYYPNKQLVQSRMRAVLPDYLPIGSNYALIVGTTAT